MEDPAAPPANEEVVVRYRWTADEMLEAERWADGRWDRPWIQHRMIWIVANWVMSVVCFAMVAFFLWQGGYPIATPLMVVPWVLRVLYFYVIQPRQIRRRFARGAEREAEVEWRISAAAARGDLPQGFSAFGWTELTKVVRTPEGFLLYPKDWIHHWLPRHGFANGEDFERLTQLAQLHALDFRRID